MSVHSSSPVPPRRRRRRAYATPWLLQSVEVKIARRSGVEIQRRLTLKRDDIRDAPKSALERYLFACVGQSVERACPACADREHILALGRFCPFVSCANFPECRYSRPLSGDPADREEPRKPNALGTDGETGPALTFRSGRYGRYVQRGEDDGDPPASPSIASREVAQDQGCPPISNSFGNGHSVRRASPRTPS